MLLKYLQIQIVGVRICGSEGMEPLKGYFKIMLTSFD